jgi:hypothetical protein
MLAPRMGGYGSLCSRSQGWIHSVGLLEQQELGDQRGAVGESFMHDAWRHGRANPSPAQRPAAPADWRAELEAVAAQLQRLSPDGRRPESYFEAKSELVGRLRRLARR